MSRERDELIRDALMAEELPLPVGVADGITASIHVVRQRPPGRTDRSFGMLPAPAVWLALLALLLLAAVLAFATARLLLRAPAVPMYRGAPDRIGVMPGPGPTGIPFVLWTAQLEGAVPSTGAPVVARGRVLVGDDGGHMSAFDAASGDRMWSRDVGSPVLAAPGILGDLVVTGTADGDVLALSLDDGADAWTWHGGGPIVGSLAVIDGTVIVPNGDGRLVALGADGVPRWTVPLGVPLDRGPAIAGDLIFQPYPDGGLVALDRATQVERWRTPLGPGSVMTPMASGDVVYVARGVGPQATEHDFVALSIVDGTVLWDHPSASQIYPGAVAGDLVLASSDDGTITALDPDGTPAWSDPAGDIQPLGMAVVGDTLYAPGADDTVRALVAVTGQQSWSVPVTGKPSIPVVIDGRVIVGTTFGAVQALGDAPASP